jgi:fatty-acyl-CoA synthase
MHYANLIRRAGREFASNTAVEDGSHARSFAELLDRSERFANALDDLSIPPDSPIGILSENRIEYPEIDGGLALGSRVRVALNARLHLDDFRHAASDCDMKALVHSARFAAEAEALREELGLETICLDPVEGGSHEYEDLLARAEGEPRERPVEPEQRAWISYTSGTTGRPKGVVLSHRAVREVAFNLLLELGPPAAGEQIVLPQPLSHGAGYFALPYLLCGAGLIVLEGFDPEAVLAFGQRPEVRTLKAVPAMLGPLIAAADGRSDAFETIIYGAAPIGPGLLDESLDAFGSVLVQIYGQSEAPMTLTSLAKADHLVDDGRRTSAGRPWRNVAVAIRDEEGKEVPFGETGEVTISGSHQMTEYHAKAEATAEVLRDGWIHTRDMGRLDHNGFVHLLGRSDEMINTGGFNVAPREVEQVLADHDAVAECVVVGLPDQRWGEAVTAIVRPHAGGDAGPDLAGDELISFSRERLGFRTPKRVLLVDEIAKNAYGKTDRVALDTLIAARTAENQGS